MRKEEFEMLYDHALSIATFSHRGQKDKAGQEYIGHPVAVASRCKTYEAKIAALLHDTIEDTYITPDYLRVMGIPEEIVDVVVLVTKQKDNPGYSYLRYLWAIKKNPIACEVKIADLSHIMDLRRLPRITAHALRRNVKYRLSYSFLSML